MDHPLRSDQNRELRKRVVQLLKNGFSIQRQSNIVFVCGGNEPNHMRKQFQLVFANLLPNYEFFEPEFAMKNYFTLEDTEPFDISEFEEFVAEISHSIIIFPEGPGSFAELGYFAGQQHLASKTLLAIDGNRQKRDSFISLGPAKKIHDASKFQPNIQLDYSNPDFSVISQRITDRQPLHKKLRYFTVNEFNNTSPFELFALIQQIVTLLRIATIEDIEFFLFSLFDGHIRPSKTKQITSVLVGSGRLIEVGQYGHLVPNDQNSQLLKLRDGVKTEHDVLTIDISACLLSAPLELKSLLEI